MTRHGLVELEGEVGNARNVGFDVIGVQRLAIDEVQDHHARLGMDEVRRKTGRRRGPAGHDLALAEDVMERKVPAETHDAGVIAVADLVALIAEPAFERLDGQGSAPNR